LSGAKVKQAALSAGESSELTDIGSRRKVTGRSTKPFGQTRHQRSSLCCGIAWQRGQLVSAAACLPFKRGRPRRTGSFEKV